MCPFSDLEIFKIDVKVVFSLNKAWDVTCYLEQRCDLVALEVINESRCKIETLAESSLLNAFRFLSLYLNRAGNKTSKVEMSILGHMNAFMYRYLCLKGFFSEISLLGAN